MGAAVVPTTQTVVIAGGRAGTGASFAIAHDIWVSFDKGVTWAELADATTLPWSVREGADLVAATSGTLELIGGQPPADSTQAFAEVWRSTDYGATWSASGTVPWVGRAKHATAVTREGKIVMSGGHYDDSDSFPEVWVSSHHAWVCHAGCARCTGVSTAECLECSPGATRNDAGVCAFLAPEPSLSLRLDPHPEAALCARGMVAVASVAAVPHYANSTVVIFLDAVTPVTEAPPGEAARARAMFALTATGATTRDLVLGKAARAGVYDVRVVATERPRPAGTTADPLASPLGANITVRVNVTCAAAEALLDNATDVAQLEAHFTFVGISGASLSMAEPGAASHIAVLEETVAQALGLPANGTSTTRTAGDGSRATVTTRIAVPASMLGGGAKTVRVTLDAGHVADDEGAPKSASHFQVAAIHAGRTLSRLVGICCAANSTEVMNG